MAGNECIFVAFSYKANARVALVSIILLVISSVGAAGLSTWKETATDFPTGQKVNTHVHNGSLILDDNPSPLNNWTKIIDGYSPPPRWMHSMVYIPSNGTHFLLGGDWSGCFNDKWTYNMSSNRWTELSLNPFPHVIEELGMAFDTQNGKVVIFGGMDGTSENWETWIYDPIVDTWTEKSSTKSPAARALHSMVYDPGSGLIILFGGLQFISGSEYKYCGDTWTYDLRKNEWIERTTGTAPPPRYAQSMCYDPASGLILLFGGKDRDTVFNDTWTYNPTSNVWINCKPPSAPSPRIGAAIAAYPYTGIILHSGGLNASVCFNDTWSYNVKNNTWMNRLPTGGPPSRYYSAMTYDQTNKKMFLFGGRGKENGFMDDFWTYDPANNTWTKQGERLSPSPRCYFSSAFDSINKVGVLFGGTSYLMVFNDTWTFDTTVNLWMRKQPAISPSNRYGAAMCYDRDDGLMILFSGASDSPDQNETWTYNVTSNTWINRHPVKSPNSGKGYSMTYDPDKHIVILFGAGGSCNRTWTYDVINNLWTDRSGPASPPHRWDSAMVYDEANRCVVLFGGMWGGPQCMNDTWLLNTTTFNWTRKSQDVSPPPRGLHSMAYDSSLGVTVLTGGWGGYYFGDTWVYDASTNLWINLTPIIAPPPRSLQGMYYDSNIQTMVLFGGYTDRPTIMGDTWTYRINGSIYSGTYTSIPKDTGGSAYFGALQWDSTTPYGTTIKLQLRTGGNQVEMEAKDFTGPDGTTGSYFDIHRQKIPSIYNGSRWMQYRAYLTAESAYTTPSLASVTVSYNLLHTVMITSPTGGENWTGKHDVLWSTSDIDGDPLASTIGIENETGNLLWLAGGPSQAANTSWGHPLNTDDFPNGTYRIRLLVFDGNIDCPLSVNMTSNYFKISNTYPGPSNHLPRVILNSPANNSYLTTSSVRLQWIGTDPDNDPLSYTIHYSNNPLHQGNILSNMTEDDHLDLIDLSDNTTYYWTVSASDGKSAGTDLPTDIWSFTVKLPPANIPVRFTSTPPLIAWVGQEYTYNLTPLDEDGDIPVFSIVSGPANMVLDSSTGKLTWTPTTSDIGNHTVTIQVADGRGSSDLQTFTITVLDNPVPPIQAPKCTITYPANGSTLKGTIQVRGTALNGSVPLKLIQVRIDAGTWTNAVGLANWTFAIDTTKLTAGRHRIEARTYDGNLSSDIASVEFTVWNPEHGVTLGGNPWCLPVGIIAIIAGICVFLLLRKIKR